MAALAVLFAPGCGDDGRSDGPVHHEAGVDHGVFDGAIDAGLPDGVPVDAKPADGPVDGPVADLPTGDGYFPKCLAVGGTCTQVRWEVCPVNTEPVEPDPHQDCANQGWCCVAAPSSTCSASAGVNCVFGSACTGCWGPATNTSLSCEAGRVCCEDICD